MPSQEFLEPRVGTTKRTVADSASLRAKLAAEGIIGSPVLQKDHQIRIYVASTPGVGRYEIALVLTSVVVADALVSWPSGLVPDVGELPQSRTLIIHRLHPSYFSLENRTGSFLIHRARLLRPCL